MTHAINSYFKKKKKKIATHLASYHPISLLKYPESYFQPYFQIKLLRLSCTIEN